MTTITVIGIFASICTGVSMLPQLIKTAKEKKAGDISLWMLAVLFAGLALWVVYGVYKSDLIIIISNSFSLLVNAAIVTLTIKYKKAPGS